MFRSLNEHEAKDEQKIFSRKAFYMKKDLAKHQRKRAGGSTFGLQSVIILEKKKDSKKVRKRETWNHYLRTHALKRFDETVSISINAFVDGSQLIVICPSN